MTYAGAHKFSLSADVTALVPPGVDLDHRDRIPTSVQSVSSNILLHIIFTIIVIIIITAILSRTQLSWPCSQQLALWSALKDCLGDIS